MKMMTDRPTSARPVTVMGVTFRCFHTGILRFAWRSEDGRLAAGRRGNTETYYCSVDGEVDKKRFRYLDTAMRGAVIRDLIRKRDARPTGK